MTSEFIEVRDPQVQEAWTRMARSGVAELAADYVLCTALVGLGQAGIAQRLSRAWTPLAALVPTGGAPHIVAGTLRYLAIREIVENDGDSWRLTSRGADLLDELPDSLLGYYVEAYGPVLNRMAGQLTGQHPYGTATTRDTEALGRRCEVLFRSFGTNLVSDVIKHHGAGAILDLGCGTGGLLLDLCKANPSLRGVGLDVAPDAIRLAEQRAVEEGLTDQVSFVVGDAFVPEQWPQPARDCDLFVAVGALHEHFRDGEDAVVNLLGTYRRLLQQPGKKAFLLAEPELHVDAADADFYLVHVLTAQGMPRPREAWLKAFARAGLNCDRVYSAPNTGFRFAYYELTASPEA